MATEEKVNPIILHDLENKEDYTLEFNRESVMFAEARGFDIEDVGRFPLTKIPELFYYAFRMHHKKMSRQQTDHILFDVLKGLPEGAAERLGALYSVPFEALNGKKNNEDNEGEALGNARMTVEL